MAATAGQRTRTKRRAVDVEPVARSSRNDRRLPATRWQPACYGAGRRAVGAHHGAPRPAAREHSERRPAPRAARVTNGRDEATALNGRVERKQLRRIDACRPQDPAENVLEEGRFRVRRFGVTAPRVPGASSVVNVRPRDRMILPHRAVARRIRRLLEDTEDVHEPRGFATKLYHSSSRRQLRGRRIVDGWRPLPTLIVADWIAGVASKLRADEADVPRPPVLGIGGRVDADEATACTDVAFERRLLPVVEDVAGREREHDRVVASESRVRERRGVFRRVDREGVRRTEPLQRLHGRGDRRVPEAGGLREDEHANGGRTRTGRRRGGACEGKRGAGCERDERRCGHGDHVVTAA